MVLSGVLCVLLSASSADTKLAEARAQLDQFQLDKALATVAQVLNEKGLTRAQLASAYEMEGVAKATRGDNAGAKDAFARLLTLDPTRAVPADLPPKVRTQWFSARSVAERATVSLTPQDATVTDNQYKQVAVQVKTSPLFPATGVRWSVRSEGQPAVVTVVPLEGDTSSVKVATRQVTWTATLLGANDAELATASREEKTLTVDVVTAPPPPPPPAVEAAAWGRAAGLTVGALGLVALGAGIGLGVMSADARRQLTNPALDSNGVVTSLTEAKAAQLEGMATTGAIAANALIIGGGVLTATGLAFFVFGPHGESAGPQVSIAPAPGGVVAVGRF